MGGIIGEESIMADTEMRKHVYGPMKKITLLKILNYSKVVFCIGEWYFDKSLGSAWQFCHSLPKLICF